MPIRPFQIGDIHPITELVHATNVFRNEEIDVAVELMEVVAKNPNQKDYVIYTYVDDHGEVQGYYCVGPTPMTVSTFDLYWIATHPRVHGKGIGYQLLAHSEQVMKSMGCSLIMVETSSLPKYEATRTFYLRNNYSEVNRIANYYAPGDDLVVYTKYI